MSPLKKSINPVRKKSLQATEVAPIGAAFSNGIKKYLPYLEDLRRRLYWSVIVFIAVFIGGFLSSGFFLKKFIAFFNIKGAVIATTSPFQLADVAMTIGFFFASLVIIPLAAWHLFSFVSAALTSKERRWFLLSVPVSLFLFVLGFTYGFFILYNTLGLLAALNLSLGIQNVWDISSFLSQIFITSSLLGFVFQFPLVLTALIRLGALEAGFLKQHRRGAVFIIFVLVSLLPPTDGLSLIIMALPLVLLYEITIFINTKRYAR
ncbi:MAG: twin-arginine translocase subunit TatC [Candidatus Sungbacteria bacterium]|uniref:Sec-independent protein translocase protein TatC n=1 Tax=Candidatus Sungiibacteriota bacterium TaxID=2750080 RepID=A0A9D6LQR4_9BACT|nr:twin-arginine translocase subunit TatC [Candidatus Sungbacteria bacterium]